MLHKKYIKYKNKYISLKKRLSNNHDLIELQIRDIPTNIPINLFSYGSNSISQLAERLGVSKNIVKDNSIPVTLKNYSVGFFGSSNDMAGSVATIYPDKGGSVHGISLKIIKNESGDIMINNSKTNFTNLMRVEGINKQMYHLSKIPNLINDRTLAIEKNCYAFIGNLDYHNAMLCMDPSSEYLSAIAIMIKDRRELLGEQNIHEPVNTHIKIYDGDNSWIDKGVYSINLL